MRGFTSASSFVLATCLAFAASGAIAQTTPATDATAPEATGAEATGAEAEPADQGGIREIVVTAQKRAENVQDVPIAISAFDSQALSERNISDVAQLSNIAPNVTLDAGTPFSGSTSVLAAFIRGIGSNDFAMNLDPGVGIYLTASIWRGRWART